VLTAKYWIQDLKEHMPGFIDDDEIEYWELLVCLFPHFFLLILNFRKNSIAFCTARRRKWRK
jgi:hypothetical protein